MPSDSPALPAAFAPEVVAAVLAHMNGDHADDNLLIVRAFGAVDATDAVMTGLDGSAGVWSTVTAEGDAREVRVPWLEPVHDRPGIRRAVVLLYRAACERLGVTPREH